VGAARHSGKSFRRGFNNFSGKLCAQAGPAAAAAASLRGCKPVRAGEAAARHPPRVIANPIAAVENGDPLSRLAKGR